MYLTYPKKSRRDTISIWLKQIKLKALVKSVNIIEEWIFKDKLDNPEEVKIKYHEDPPTVYGFGHTTTL